MIHVCYMFGHQNKSGRRLCWPLINEYKLLLYHECKTNLPFSLLSNSISMRGALLSGDFVLIIALPSPCPLCTLSLPAFPYPRARGHLACPFDQGHALASCKLPPICRRMAAVSRVNLIDQPFNYRV